MWLFELQKYEGLFSKEPCFYCEIRGDGFLPGIIWHPQVPLLAHLNVYHEPMWGLSSLFLCPEAGHSWQGHDLGNCHGKAMRPLVKFLSGGLPLQNLCCHRKKKKLCPTNPLIQPLGDSLGSQIPTPTPHAWNSVNSTNRLLRCHLADTLIKL